MAKMEDSRRIPTVILIIAVIGAIYFGYQVIFNDSETNPENPFEYNIEHFKKSDSSLHHYIEAGQIKLAENTWRGIAVDAKGSIYVSF
jgi:hypothetical protein